jgi:DNA-binding CsgD family transcriptional regulator
MNQPIGPNSGFPLVGRSREQDLLQAELDAALTGHGRLFVLSGPAGIGKTTLARYLTRTAAERGCAVLSGSCYDLAYTSPFSPWLEVFDACRRIPDAPPPPAAFTSSGVTDMTDRTALFAEAREYLASLTAGRPALIVLDDLHWSDEESLELLRHIGPHLRHWPMLLLATYRADELLPTRPFMRHLPGLIRESDAGRLELRRLDTTALHHLTGIRYTLSPADEAMLVEYLDRHAEGHPFFAVELLRVLEEEKVIVNHAGAWSLDRLDRIVVPPLVQQTIDLRVDRLGEGSRRALSIAAVIGQDVPLDLWAGVANLSESDMLDIVDRAVTSSLVEASPEGDRVSFVHALTRESLYESMLPPRRRRVHQEVAGALLKTPNPNADAVAYHLEKAGDPRAWEWMIEAGHRAQRVYAWRTAIDRFRTAAGLLANVEGEERVRGWLLLRYARLLRVSEPRQAISILDDAEQLAARSGDRRLAGEVVYGRGLNLCYADQFQQGIGDLTTGVALLNTLTPEEFRNPPEFEIAIADALPEHVPRDIAADQLATSALHEAGLNARHGTLPWFYASTGRPMEAIDLAEQFLAALEGIPRARGLAHAAVGHALHGLGVASAAVGKPGQASKAFADARQVLAELDHHAVIAFTLINELHDVALTYEAGSPALRRELAARAEASLDRAGSATQPGVSSRLAWIAPMVLDGRWAEAAGLLDDLPRLENAFLRRNINMPLGTLSRLRGDPDRAWAQVWPLLPDGPATEPGDAIHQEGLGLQRLAAALCLDAGDLPAAKAWLEAHDRWLAWSGSTLGAADGTLSWARFFQSAGQPDQARDAAANAIDLATAPDQPLIALGAHRLLGRLAAREGDYLTAEQHLETALRLATTCETPFDRGLALVALAELRSARGAAAESTSILDQAIAIFEQLDALPALTIARTIEQSAGSIHRAPRDQTLLTPRELDVLRLLAQHQTNREIAEALFISPRTVQSHVEHICAKLAVDNRRQAAAKAAQLGLI